MSRSVKMFSRLCFAVMLLLFFSAALVGSEGDFAFRNLLLSIPLSPADSSSFTVRREGNILAVRTKDERFFVYDLVLEQELFRQESGFSAPVFELFEDSVLFTPSGESDMTLLNVRTGDKRALPYRFDRRLTDDGVVLTRSGHVLKLPEGDVLFQREPNKRYSGSYLFAAGDILFFPRVDRRRHFSGYDALNREGAAVFSLDDSPSRTLYFHESSGRPKPLRPRTFPLPVVRWSGDAPALRFLSERGDFFGGVNLEEAGIAVVRASPSPLEILDQTDGRYLLTIRGLPEAGRPPSFSYLLTASSGDITVLLRNGEQCSGWFAPDGGILLGSRGKSPILRRFSATGQLEGEFLLEECTLRHGFFVSDSEMLFASDFFPYTFMKVDTRSGSVTGMYPFPPGMTMMYADSFFRDGKVYTFSSSRPSIPSPLRGGNFVCFDAGGHGWLDIEMAPLDPHAGSPFSTFERTGVNVRFLHEYGRSFGDLLRVTFGGGTVSAADPSAGRYVWETPSTEGAELLTVPVEVRLGPIAKVFEVTLQRLRNPLLLAVSKRIEVQPRFGNLRIFADWQLSNPAPYDLDDLSWGFEGTNLKPPRLSGLPSRMRSGESRSGSVELALLYDGMEGDPSVRGYSVEGRGRLVVTAGRGNPVAGEIEHDFFVPDAYSFRILLFDPELNRYSPLEYHLRALRVFDEEGNEITPFLTLSKRGAFDIFTGVAAGLPGKPVRLRVKVHEMEEWADVEFRPNTTPKETHPWSIPLPLVRITLGPNKPPFANFRILPQNPKWSPVTVFDASLSYDPDGIITRYLWSFGFSPDSVETTSPLLEHRFGGSGAGRVMLTVVDNKGATSSVAKTVHSSKPIVVAGEETAGQSVFQSFPSAAYEVTVYTGDRSGAGTDAFVYMALHGPPDASGTPTGSGEIPLSGYMPASGKTDLFEREQKDVFTIPANQGYSSLDEVASMTLRHDNTGNRPDWFVEGVVVKNPNTGAEWFFPADRWLASDKGADTKTYAEFQPLASAYDCGILFGGETRSIGMTEASDTIFILPAGVSSFHFTQLEGSWEVLVFRDGVLAGRHTQSGVGLREPLLLSEHGRGISYDASLVTSPVRFRVQLGPYGSVRKDGYVWVLPSSWAGYEKTARMAMLAESLIRGMRQEKPAEDPYDIFSAGQSAVNVFEAARPNAAVSGRKVVAYGMSSLSIFGGIEDVQLDLIKDMASNEYFHSKIRILLPQILSKTYLSAMGTAASLFTSMFSAWSWATEFFTTSIFNAASDSYKVDLLNHLADADSYFLQAAELMEKSGELLRTALSAFEQNDPAACREAFDRITLLVLGPNPGSIAMTDHRIADYGAEVSNSINHPDTQYPLMLLLAIKMQNIESWREEGHSFLKYYWYQDAPGLDYLLATRAAMPPFEKAIRDMARISGILAQICLAGQ